MRPSAAPCRGHPDTTRADWRIALATNAAASKEDEIWQALARAGLDRLLDKVYCYRTIGHKKPSREFFNYILRDLRWAENLCFWSATILKWT